MAAVAKRPPLTVSLLWRALRLGRRWKLRGGFGGVLLDKLPGMPQWYGGFAWRLFFFLVGGGEGEGFPFKLNPPRKGGPLVSRGHWLSEIPGSRDAGILVGKYFLYRESSHIPASPLSPLICFFKGKGQYAAGPFESLWFWGGNPLVSGCNCDCSGFHLLYLLFVFVEVAGSWHWATFSQGLFSACLSLPSMFGPWSLLVRPSRAVMIEIRFAHPTNLGHDLVHFSPSSFAGLERARGIPCSMFVRVAMCQKSKKGSPQAPVGLFCSKKRILSTRSLFGPRRASLGLMLEL